MSQQDKKSQVLKHTLKWGSFLGITGAAYYFIIYATNQMMNTKVGFGVYPVIFIICLLGVMQYRKKITGGYISFNEAFKASYLPFFVSAVINIIYQLLFLKFVMTPAYIDNMVGQLRERLLAQGLSEQQIEFSIKIPMAMMKNPVAIVVVTLFTFALTGAVISVVIAAICKKENPQVDFENI